MVGTLSSLGTPSAPDGIALVSEANPLDCFCRGNEAVEHRHEVTRPAPQRCQRSSRE
jgi:hypothetical protein